MDTALSIASSIAEDTEEESGVALAAAGPHGLQSRRHTQTNRKPRTKGLVKKLQQQIDFYFGDANLSKDKFLQQKIKEDPDGYIPVGIIAGFKKMKALSEDLSLIKKAMDNSTVVELSENREKVRRSQPLPQMDTTDIDSRTIYIENLPTHLAEHEAIKKLFKMFGKITYVSLPRHKTSGVAKGFAFVEFSSSGEASTALEFFKNKDTMSQVPKDSKPSTVVSKEDGVDGSSADVVGGERVMEGGETMGGLKRKREEEHTTGPDSPEQLPATKRTRTTSPCAKDQASTIIHLHGDVETPPTSSDQQTEQHADQHTAGAESAEMVRAAQSPDKPGSGQLVGKRRRSCDEEMTLEGQSEEPPIKATRLESQSSETDYLDVMEAGTVEGGGQKKKRKNRQHKKRQHSSSLRDLDIRVMSKSEWSELKKLYCDLQKDHMKQVKKELQDLSGREGDGGRRRETKGFIGRCLVKVECGGEGGANVKEIKEACSCHGRVAYTDIKDGDKEGYVRYEVSGCVDKLLESDAPVTDTTFSAVSEENERAYFLKCQAQRKQQFNIKGKKKQRGQDKLVSKALKKLDHDLKQPSHIRFSDDESDS